MYERLADIKHRLEIPTQTCILGHITTQMKCAEAGAEVDMIFQSVSGSERTNSSFGITKAMVDEAADLLKHRGSSTGPCRLYFETGEGPEDSAEGDHGTDQATMESRTYGFCRHYDPFLVDTVLGFLGPEYLYDRQQHTRCALEDLFMAKMHDINIGADCCYIVSMEMDQNDEENTAMLLTLAGCHFLIAIPQGDDPMLMYQSLGFHDIAALRTITHKEPAPEFKKWLEKWGLWEDGHLTERAGDASIFMGSR
jgi:ethanolamine ammonia-lyase large subunit